MKKYSAIALMLAAALTLSACGNGKKENNNVAPSQTTTGNASGENSGENTDGQQPEAEISEDMQKVIDVFDMDSFTAPDGTEVMLTEASDCLVNESMLFFDFAYIGYAWPVYSDTVIDPGLYDFETYEFREDASILLEHKPVKVVKGDVLDNGMTVTEAKYVVMPAEDGVFTMSNEVIMEGECELEGVLLCFADDNYMFAQDDVLFFPNPTTGAVPMPYGGIEMTKTGTDLKFAFMNDGGEISLGSVHEMAVDIADWFEDYDSYVRVKVTLDGLRIRYADTFGIRGWSTLKSAERLDS